MTGGSTIFTRCCSQNKHARSALAPKGQKPAHDQKAHEYGADKAAWNSVRAAGAALVRYQTRARIGSYTCSSDTKRAHRYSLPSHGAHTTVFKTQETNSQ